MTRLNHPQLLQSVLQLLNDEGSDGFAESHLDEIRALWQNDAAGYLRAVEPGVHAMLTAACRFPATT